MKISKKVVSYSMYLAMGLATAAAGLNVTDPMWWVIIAIFVATEINAERK